MLLAKVRSGDTRGNQCKGHSVDVGRRQIAAALLNAGDGMPAITSQILICATSLGARVRVRKPQISVKRVRWAQALRGDRPEQPVVAKVGP